MYKVDVFSMDKVLHQLSSVTDSDRLSHLLHGFITVSYTLLYILFWMVNGEHKFWEAPSKESGTSTAWDEFKD